MRNIVLGAMISCVASTTLAGDLINGNVLLNACSQPSGSAMDGFCSGYIIGVVEGMKWGAGVPAFLVQQEGDDINSMISSMLQFCSPEEATWSQSIDIVVRYLTENPSQRHLPARGLVQESLIHAFPCP